MMIAESKPKKKIEEERTVFVGKRLMRGAIAIEPTHWKAWLRPCIIASLVAVEFLSRMLNCS